MYGQSMKSFFSELKKSVPFPLAVNQLESSEFDVGISLLTVSNFHKVMKLMTMFMMLIDIASVEIVEKVQVTRRHSTICTMFTKVKTHQNSACWKHPTPFPSIWWLFYHAFIICDICILLK